MLPFVISPMTSHELATLVTELNELELVWLSVPISKQYKYFDEINFAVTQRMTHLQLPPTNTTMNRECLEHFYPTEMAARNELGSSLNEE
jgi:hypothetical protein